MLEKLIHRLLLRRHFWRQATFSEIAELYASRTLRLFALRLVSTFTAIYLYQEGYSLAFIALFWAGFYFVKVLAARPSASIIARFGPKHATLASNIISAVGMILLPFTTHPELGLAALTSWAILQGFSGSLNDLAYLVDFSKVKHMEHAGKEIGFMNIFERVASGLSPIIGGFIAFLAGPEAVMLLSAVLFLLSAVPLLLTAEPVKTHRKLDFSGFPWRTTWRSFVAEAAVGADVFATGIAWSLLLVVIIFQSGTDRVYAEVGVITSISLFVAFIASQIYGKLIDRKRGGELLKYSTLFNSAIHASRVLVTTPISAIATNIANEAATTGYAMAFTRGLFDTADISGKRLEYLYIIEIVINVGALLSAVLLGMLFLSIEAGLSFQVYFILIGIVTLLIATPRFVLYKK